MGSLERSLAWDGCFNVRDLGGLETTSGRRTRHGAVVRPDNIRTLERRRETVAAAVGAVAAGDLGKGVVIHCFAGKDRTGIISALVLSVADVPDEVIASDYAESAPNMRHLFDGWIAAADDDLERELRRRLAAAEHETMLAVLAWLRDAGGSRAYLSDAGLASDQIDRLERRLVEVQDA